MPHSTDIAEYILQRLGPMSSMKLQKLVYYAQAWSLVWDRRPLFDDEIQAWANGPVAPELYQRHRGEYIVRTVGGDAALISSDDDAAETVEGVLRYYGIQSSQWLSDLTHAEDPWKAARAELPAGARSENVISHESMASYYRSL